MKIYKCNECGFNCFACYAFDCNRNDKTASKSHWILMGIGTTLTTAQIEEIKKEAVEDYLKNDVPEFEEQSIDNFVCDECEGGPCSISIDNKHGDCGRFNKNVRKESKLMTLQEALLKCEDNDALFYEIGEEGCPSYLGIKLNADHKRNVKGQVHDELNFDMLTSKKWQIIPAEPEIFNSSKEAFNHFYKIEDLADNPYFSDHDMNVFGCTMEQNGQLKERQNLQPLIDVMKDGGKTLEEWHEKAFEAFNKIKPL